MVNADAKHEGKSKYLICSSSEAKDSSLERTHKTDQYLLYVLYKPVRIEAETERSKDI